MGFTLDSDSQSTLRERHFRGAGKKKKKKKRKALHATPILLTTLEKNVLSITKDIMKLFPFHVQPDIRSNLYS